MTLLDVSVTNVALPSIGDDTGAGPSQLQWIVSGYTLAFGLVPVLGGKLGDDHGRRLMFQVGVGGFVVTSALSGLAPTAGFLIARAGAAGAVRRPDQPADLRADPADVPRRRPRPRLRRPGYDGRARHRDRAARRRRADRARRPDARAGGWSSSSTSRSASSSSPCPGGCCPRRARPPTTGSTSSAPLSSVVRPSASCSPASSTTPSATPGWRGWPSRRSPCSGSSCAGSGG